MAMAGLECVPNSHREEAGERRCSRLYRDGLDSAPMIDMQPRMYPGEIATYAILAAALAAGTPWVGWLPLAILLAALACYKAADSLAPKLARREHWWLAIWTAAALATALGASVSGGLRSPVLSWLAIPVLALCTRFSLRGVVLGALVAILMLIGVTVFGNDHLVVAKPPLLLAPVALFLCLPLLTLPLMRSEIDHRTQAVTDGLTGLFNRTALKVRSLELAQQSRVTGEPVGVIVCHIDHFRIINDEYGRSVGDAVLENVAVVLRWHLRAFDLAYRLGGAEFVILLPGSDLGDCSLLADRLHSAIHANETGPVPIAMSFGVSASRPQDVFDYDHVFAEADRALDTAKRKGCDRVCVSAAAAPAAREATNTSTAS